MWQVDSTKIDSWSESLDSTDWPTINYSLPCYLYSDKFPPQQAFLLDLFIYDIFFYSCPSFGNHQFPFCGTPHHFSSSCYIYYFLLPDPSFSFLTSHHGPTGRLHPKLRFKAEGLLSWKNWLFSGIHCLERIIFSLRFSMFKTRKTLFLSCVCVSHKKRESHLVHMNLPYVYRLVITLCHPHKNVTSVDNII